MVRLEEIALNWNYVNVSYFNSSMVRLEEKK